MGNKQGQAGREAQLSCVTCHNLSPKKATKPRGSSEFQRSPVVTTSGTGKRHKGAETGRPEAQWALLKAPIKLHRKDKSQCWGRSFGEDKSEVHVGKEGSASLALRGKGSQSTPCFSSYFSFFLPVILNIPPQEKLPCRMQEHSTFLNKYC